MRTRKMIPVTVRTYQGDGQWSKRTVRVATGPRPEDLAHALRRAIGTAPRRRPRARAVYFTLEPGFGSAAMKAVLCDSVGVVKTAQSPFLPGLGLPLVSTGPVSEPDLLPRFSRRGNVHGVLGAAWGVRPVDVRRI